MQNKRQINTDIELTRAVGSITQAYEEISVLHIQKVKARVIKSRQFLENLEVVFGDVKESYKQQLEELFQKKKAVNQGALSLLSKNGKSAVVLISSNTPLYGEIIHTVFNEFVNYVAKNKSDIVIVGKYGKKLYDERKMGSNYEFYELPDISVKFEDLREMILKLIAYQRVDIFYGQFENTMTQVSHMGNISGQAFFESESVNPQKHKIVFEPTLETVLQFFETQVFNNLLHQVVAEAELARHGSRIKAMETAHTKIEKEEKILLRKRSALKKMMENKKRLDRLAGMTLWGVANV